MDTHIAQVLRVLLSSFIHWSLRHHRIVLESLNTFGPVLALKVNKTWYGDELCNRWTTGELAGVLKWWN